MLDIMPSRKLVIHEYRLHGTCSGLHPAPYYALARRLFTRIRIPERYQNPFEIAVRVARASSRASSCAPTRG